jgi:hypothetical protein
MATHDGVWKGSCWSWIQKLSGIVCEIGLVGQVNYIFTIQTRGDGETPEEAWADAVENITGNLSEFLDESDVPDYRIGEDEEDDEQV